MIEYHQDLGIFGKKLPVIKNMSCRERMLDTRRTIGFIFIYNKIYKKILNESFRFLTKNRAKPIQEDTLSINFG